MEDRKIYRERCKICNKEIVGLTENQVRWLHNVHKMTHDKEKGPLEASKMTLGPNLESNTNQINTTGRL
jgi:hypothetical protein